MPNAQSQNMNRPEVAEHRDHGKGHAGKVTERVAHKHF